jgi:hypothetical protein
MKINGKVATSGTLVIGAGQSGEIELPWGQFTLIFNPMAAIPNITINPAAHQIVFEGTDNPLGIATSILIPLSSGQNATINFAVYSLGEGSSVTRVVHYSLIRG